VELFQCFCLLGTGGVGGMLCCLRACFHTATLAPDCVGNLRRFRQLSAYCASLYLVSFVEPSGTVNSSSNGSSSSTRPIIILIRAFHYQKLPASSSSDRGTFARTLPTCLEQLQAKFLNVLHTYCK